MLNGHNEKEYFRSVFLVMKFIISKWNFKLPHERYTYVVCHAVLHAIEFVEYTHTPLSYTWRPLTFNMLLYACGELRKAISTADAAAVEYSSRSGFLFVN